MWFLFKCPFEIFTWVWASNPLPRASFRLISYGNWVQFPGEVLCCCGLHLQSFLLLRDGARLRRPARRRVCHARDRAKSSWCFSDDWFGRKWRTPYASFEAFPRHLDCGVQPARGLNAGATPYAAFPDPQLYWQWRLWVISQILQ